LNGFGRPKWSLRFCQFISVLESDYVFQFKAGLSIRYHLGQAVLRRYTSTWRITFRNRYILSSLPPSPIGTDRKHSQKRI
jgi:hypothetical protein